MRLRDLGIVPGRLPAGEYNAITDVPGVRVGHTTLFQGDTIRTGVTVVLPHEDNLFLQKVPAAVHTINGFGKACGFEQVRELGRLETPIALTNTLNVARVADALITYTLQHNPDVTSVNPLVGECNDSFLNDIQARAVTAEHVFSAIETASSGRVAEGNVGAGTGTGCYGFKGGIGTASRLVQGFTVGALVQTNFGERRELTILGVPVGKHLADTLLPTSRPPDGSIMMILATDAPLEAYQLLRLAKRAGFGLARTGTIGHHGSGDFVIAFSTQNRYLHFSQDFYTSFNRINDTLLESLFGAVVESVEEAIYNALIAAETMTGNAGHTVFALPHDKLQQLLITRQ